MGHVQGSGVHEEAAVTHKNRDVVSSQTVRWTAPDAGKGNLTAVYVLSKAISLINWNFSFLKLDAAVRLFVS